MAEQSGMATQQVTFGQVRKAINTLHNIGKAENEQIQETINFVNNNYFAMFNYIKKKMGDDDATIVSDCFSREFMPNPNKPGNNYGDTILDIDKKNKRG